MLNSRSEQRAAYQDLLQAALSQIVNTLSGYCYNEAISSHSASG
jgi:hypothetical protein